MGLATISTWIKENVIGEGEKAQAYRAAAAIPVPDPRGEKIKSDLKKDQELLEKTRKDLENIKDVTSIRTPQLSDFSNKDLLLMGGAGGGAVGGGLGMMDGLVRVWWDEPKVSTTWQSKEIMNPKLNGFQESMVKDVDTQPRFDRDGNPIGVRENLKGQFHNFVPNISYEKVGEYKSPSSIDVQHDASGNPVTEGFKGVFQGAIIGTGIAGLIIVARKIAGKQDAPTDSDKGGPDPGGAKAELKVIAGSGAAGMATGAVVSLLSSALEASHSTEETVKWKEPIIEKKVIGEIPKNHYHSIFGTVDEAKIGKEQVTAEGPAMKSGILGIGDGPKMKEMEKTVQVEPRYGVAGQVVGGIVIGGITGVLLGVVLNILRKVI